jgi:ATP synthase protein I
MHDPAGGDNAKRLRALGALSAVGIAFVLAVVIGFLAGYGLDSWLGTSPLFTLVFFFFGVAAGVLNVVRTASSVTRNDAARKP